MQRTIILTIACLLLTTASADAFSVGPSFFWLSNYELTKQADAIILAKATKLEKDKLRIGQIHFTVISSLKGDYKDKSFVTYGRTDEFYGRSKRGDFSSARNGTYRGMGIALDFQIGQHYLLFLKKRGDKWHTGSPALSRTQEEIDPDNSPWLVAVKLYIEIDALKDYEKEKAALKKLAAKVAAGTDPKKYPPGLADDIKTHFAKPSPQKSHKDLMVFWKSAKNDRERQKVLYAVAQAGHKESLVFVRKHIGDEKFAYPLLKYVEKAKDAQCVEPIAAHFFAGRYSRTSVARSVVTIAGKTHTKTMLRMLKACKSEDEMKIVLSYFERYPSKEACASLAVAVGGEYDKKWHLTLILAEMGDEDVVQWAMQLHKSGEDKKQIRALCVLGASPSKTADAAVRKILAKADDNTVLDLFYAHISDKKYKHPSRWKRLETIVTRGKKSPAIAKKMKAILEQYLKSSTPQKAKKLKELLDILQPENSEVPTS